MSYYKADRIERKNKRKAVVITTLLYLGAFAFFMAKDGINWKNYVPFLEEVVSTNNSVEESEEVASVPAIRP